jgi:uncharacterized protein (DUF1800 family)
VESTSVISDIRPASIASFNDVSQSHPFYTEISNIAAREITLGCGNGNYCPDSFVTREQMAVFIVRALGVFDPPVPEEQRFADVPPTRFGYAFIDLLAVKEITQGCSSENFCPDDFVTREQMAVFLIRAAGVLNPPTPATQRFADVPPTTFGYAFIEELARRGITAGCGGGNYCPAAFVTRAQMAVFLVRGFGLTDPGLPGPSFANTSRFLEQATFGPNPTLVAHVQQVGIDAYIEEQFAAPMSSYPSMPLQPTTVPPTCDSTCQRDNYSMYLLQRRFYENALYGPDQLRQRVAFALHKILVVSGRDLMQASWMVPYLQIIDRNAFGNYRQLLYEITLNPAMGRYLDMYTSTRQNPNENYAREVLQLFSVGTEKLNPDGTPQRDEEGNVIPTYDQDIVDGFTRVFTGWRLAAQPSPGVANYVDPMVVVANNHNTQQKELLNGVILPASQPAAEDLNEALDNIFHHPNVPPFISKHLINSLVTSNPSGPYVERVASVFRNNGQGVRGDLRAVVKAILLDPEARGEGKGDVNYGHLREPALFICNVLRAFNPRSADGTSTSDGYLNPQSQNMDQDILRPPTVFSYFPADYDLPGSGSLRGPEFGILSTSTTLRRANFVNTIVFSTISVTTNAPRGTSIDLSGLQTLAGNPAAMVDEVNRRLMYGSMSASMRNSIIGAVTAVSASNTLKRARTAVYLTATSSQYQVQR